MKSDDAKALVYLALGAGALYVGYKAYKKASDAADTVGGVVSGAASAVGDAVTGATNWAGRAWDAATGALGFGVKALVSDAEAERVEQGYFASGGYYAVGSPGGVAQAGDGSLLGTGSSFSDWANPFGGNGLSVAADPIMNPETATKKKICRSGVC